MGRHPLVHIVSLEFPILHVANQVLVWIVRKLAFLRMPIPTLLGHFNLARIGLFHEVNEYAPGIIPKVGGNQAQILLDGRRKGILNGFERANLTEHTRPYGRAIPFGQIVHNVEGSIGLIIPRFIEQVMRPCPTLFDVIEDKPFPEIPERFPGCFQGRDTLFALCIAKMLYQALGRRRVNSERIGQRSTFIPDAL